MSDIVTRLRRWTHDVNAAPASDLMDQAADAIERLRLTDEEREAIALAMDWLNGVEDVSADACARRNGAAGTLRNLLERTRNRTLGGRETVQ